MIACDFKQFLMFLMTFICLNGVILNMFLCFNVLLLLMIVAFKLVLIICFSV